MIGIYCIENIINGKKYIGQSHDIKTRWIHHCSDLNNNRHHNPHLQGAWNMYGEESFEFYVIEETSLEELDERETYWIDKLCTNINGYNLDRGGKGIRGYKHTEEEIEKMRRIQNPEVVLQFDLNFNFIKRWSGGVSHIDKEMNYTKECLLLRCEHSIGTMKPYKESYWVYENEYLHPNFSWNKYLNNIIVYSTSKKQKDDHIDGKIYQYSPKKELIKIWDNLTDIRNSGFNDISVMYVLKHKHNRRTANGYIWCYEDYDFSDGYFDGILKNPSRVKFGAKRSVAKIDVNTKEIIKVYPSITEANKEFGGSASILSKAAKSNATLKSKGYYWKYMDE